MKHFQAIIFDMDGVIVDSEPLHERAFREVFHSLGHGESHGIHFPDYYGRSDRAVWLDFMAKHQPSQALAELIEWKQNRFLEILRAEQPIFEGMLELLEKLSGRYALALASGSHHPIIDGVLELKNLRRFFQAVVSAQDVGREKPAPDIFLRAAELLRAPPADCCVVEDSVAGVEGALAAGMKVIGITNSVPAEKLTRATKVVRAYAEIERLLL